MNKGNDGVQRIFFEASYFLISVFVRLPSRFGESFIYSRTCKVNLISHMIQGHYTF